MGFLAGADRIGYIENIFVIYDCYLEFIQTGKLKHFPAHKLLNPDD